MRIESVSITAFGPFKDKTLTFSPRMTVVHGPNEAGKSTWHSAVYAALCGIRRAAGKRKEDKEFEERHRPWDSEDWRVGARILLADGRRVKIDQELVHRVDCKAQLLDAEGLEADDLSQEIINEGTPDASRWLGLDRRSFLSTACVRQAELARTTEDSEELQVQLQRAAATGGTDATAAAALEAIDDFLSEHVGLDRANSTRPLRRATVRLAEAHEALEHAATEHADYLKLAAATEDARRNRDTATQRVRRAEALLASREAESATEDCKRARALTARSSGGPPPDAFAETSLTEQAVTALAEWRNRPTPRVPSGPSSAELRRELTELPEEPSGDLEPSASVLTAESDYRAAMQRLQIHKEPAPAVTPTKQPGPFTRLIIVAGVFLLGAAGLAFARRLDWAVGAVIAAVGFGALALLRRSKPGREAVFEEVQRYELARWQERDGKYRAAVEAAERSLHLALDERDALPGDDAAQRFEQYQAACKDRVKRSAFAAGRPQLERALEERTAREEELEAGKARAAELESTLVEVAQRCGVSSESTEQTVRAVEGWLDRRRTRAAGLARAQTDWAGLQALLAGRDVEELCASAATLSERAARLKAALAEGQLAEPNGGSTSEADLPAARNELEAASAAVAQLEGALGERAEHVPDVAEAEEELASAKAELSRVQDLSLLLERASRFLKHAQERVHRDVAPILANDVRANLAAVTGARYTDVKVDPQTLRVEVRSSDGLWCDAALLSYGTTEQIYLLLRVAVANLLTSSTESCPLLVDDITAQWDTDRTVAVLDLLRRLSEQRQVVVFSQEVDVLAWAEKHLADESNGFIRLPPPSTSPQ
ncbi:MAG: AAA family ATPase [Acidobacteriota bacterium]